MQIPKNKIINDPVHGFISIVSPLIQKLIEHPYVQRLRNIKQLGLTHMVYPGACHNRFQHALGAMHLMGLAVETLRAKGHTINSDEKEAALIAILLHDIGHGPFSHALEYSIVDTMEHETMSFLMMEQLNREFNGSLDLAIQIFSGKYPKQFLNDLVSSQLDVDRLDYLRRDSFFSGVIEGMVGVDRLIKMMEVVENKLVMEAKAIYSIEKFLLSRRLMYWQVYLHKTVLAAEHVVVQIIRRAKVLTRQKHKLFSTPALQFFLENNIHETDALLYNFALLSDCDIESAIKVWAQSSDPILSYLCNMLLNRNLFKVMLQNKQFDDDKIRQLNLNTMRYLNISEPDLSYFIINAKVSNKLYSEQQNMIRIMYNDGRVVDLHEVSDLFSTNVLGSETSKFMLCYPKIKDGYNALNNN